MSGLPRISGRDCVKALGKAGFYFKRQEGSHIILRRDALSLRSSFPITRNWIEALYARSFGRLA